MIGAGIQDGDLLLVKKEKEFKSGDIVLAYTMDGYTVKRLIHKDRKIFFQPENPKYNTIPVCEETIIKGKIIKNLSR
jgi:repressor LexA